MKLKHTFRQHRKLAERYLSKLQEKQKAHTALHMTRYPAQDQIDLLKEQVEIFRNLEYVGTPTGELTPTQLPIFA